MSYLYCKTKGGTKYYKDHAPPLHGKKGEYIMFEIDERIMNVTSKEFKKDLRMIKSGYRNMISNYDYMTACDFSYDFNSFYKKYDSYFNKSTGNASDSIAANIIYDRIMKIIYEATH